MVYYHFSSGGVVLLYDLLFIVYIFYYFIRLVVVGSGSGCIQTVRLLAILGYIPYPPLWISQLQFLLKISVTTGGRVRTYPLVDSFLFFSRAEDESTHTPPIAYLRFLRLR